VHGERKTGRNQIDQWQKKERSQFAEHKSRRRSSIFANSPNSLTFAFARLEHLSRSVKFHFLRSGTGRCFLNLQRCSAHYASSRSSPSAPTEAGANDVTPAKKFGGCSQKTTAENLA
jgi:hypothetical protein